MKVTIKASGGTQNDVEVAASETIADVKARLEPLFEMPAASQRLIFRGRIAKDSDTLEALKVTDGSSMHLVRSAAGAAPPAAAPAAPTPAASPAAGGFPAGGFPAGGFPAGGFPAGGFDPSMLAGMDLGAGGMPAMDPAMIGQMMQNPLMQQMMQNFMSNPELLRSMVSNNPLLQGMAQNNPAIRETLNNPELLSQLMNPALFGGAAAAAPTRAPAAAPAAGMPDLSALLGGGAGGLNPDVMANMNRMMQDPATQQRINDMMQNMGGMFGAPTPTPPPAGTNLAELYAAQLKTLEEMGFPDRDANLNALSAANGDVNRAISSLLERGFGN